MGAGMASRRTQGPEVPGSGEGRRLLPDQLHAGLRRQNSLWLGPRTRPLLLKAPKNTHVSHPFQAAQRPCTPCLCDKRTFKIV